MPPTPDVFNLSAPASFNGYHLLNEVSTGGTLSSLFSILSLFTEDIKLAYTPPEEDESDHGEVVDGLMPNNDSDHDLLSAERLRNKSRANSDVSQLDDDAMGQRLDSPQSMSPTSSETGRGRSSSVGTRRSTVRQGSRSPHVADTIHTQSSSSLPVSAASSPVLGASSKMGVHATTQKAAELPGPSRGSVRNEKRFEKLRPAADIGAGSKALKGTIARATVDTTLAVIPAKAFIKLTKKHPKASGTVVQVVLERFSRVTFMTGLYLASYMYNSADLRFQLTNSSASHEKSFDQNPR